MSEEIISFRAQLNAPPDAMEREYHRERRIRRRIRRRGECRAAPTPRVTTPTRSRYVGDNDGARLSQTSEDTGIVIRFGAFAPAEFGRPGDCAADVRRAFFRSLNPDRNNPVVFIDPIGDDCLIEKSSANRSKGQRANQHKGYREGTIGNTTHYRLLFLRPGIREDIILGLRELIRANGTGLIGEILDDVTAISRVPTTGTGIGEEVRYRRRADVADLGERGKGDTATDLAHRVDGCDTYRKLTERARP